ncbi:MAG: YsnF/AvaK domain-containing protein [Ktedonobacteraceae bacterium]
MTTRQPMVVAVFDDRAQAEQAINDLENAGFSDDQIRFAGHGTSSGGILEKFKSLFTGQETGAAYDDLVSMGVPPDDASYYQREYEAGHSILAVVADGRMEEARAILTRYGGYAANRRFAQTADAVNTADTANTAGTGMQETETEGEQGLKLREEQLRVQKQPVEKGEARLRKDVVTEQKSIDVPVSREEVYVERRPGSGQPADQPIGEEGETYRVPVREEQVTVEKQPVVREEMALGKRQVQETQQVSDTLKREKARVEREGDVGVQGSDVQNVSDQTDQTTP